MSWISAQGANTPLRQRFDDELKHVSHLVENKMFPGPYETEFSYWKKVAKNGVAFSVLSLLTAWGPTKNAAPIVRVTARFLWPQVITFAYLFGELTYMARYFPDSKRSVAAEVLCPSMSDDYWKEKCAIYNQKKDKIDVRAIVAAAQRNKNLHEVVKETIRLTKNGETTTTTTTTIRKGEVKVVRLPTDESTGDHQSPAASSSQDQRTRRGGSSVSERSGGAPRARPQPVPRRSQEIEQAERRMAAKQVEDDDSRLKAINAHIEENRRLGKYDTA